MEHGDFWQYNWMSNTNAYWTGYFSTYPDFKKTAVHFTDFVQGAQLMVAPQHSFLEDQVLLTQSKLLERVSIMQHHDAMTGTHPYATGEDYKNLMKDATRTTLD